MRILLTARRQVRVHIAAAEDDKRVFFWRPVPNWLPVSFNLIEFFKKSGVLPVYSRTEIAKEVQ